MGEYLVKGLEKSKWSKSNKIEFGSLPKSLVTEMLSTYFYRVWSASNSKGE